MLKSIFKSVRYHLSFFAKSVPIVAGGVLALSAPAMAITVSDCPTQFDEMAKAADEAFLKEDSQQFYQEFMNSGDFSFASINALNSEQMDDLLALEASYREIYNDQNCTDSVELCRFFRAEKEAHYCLFEKKKAELSSRAGAASTQLASTATGIEDDSEPADITTPATVAKSSSGDGYDYDDFNHTQCIEVEPLAPGGSGSEMAYGHFLLKNTCAYPVKLLTCFAFDRADGKPSPNYDLHVEGEKCPGMGWGGSALAANEVRDVREWYEYNHIKWEVKVCQEGWDFVGADGQYPAGILGEQYRCRRRAV